MRLGILADIHGNIVALDACLKVFDNKGIDDLFFIGDAVGYMSMAEEVLRRLTERKASCLMGNHESMLIGDLELEEDREKVYQLKIIRKELPEYLIDEIQSWSVKKELCIDDRKLLFVHGSPWETLTGYVYPDSDLEDFSKLSADIVFMGHTHLPFIKKIADTLVVNVGSCGLPRDHGALASCAVYDTSTDKCHILRVPFDPEEVLAKARWQPHPDVISCLKKRGADKPIGELVT